MIIPENELTRFIAHKDKLVKQTVGRNDLCPCRSGENYKDCCLMR